MVGVLEMNENMSRQEKFRKWWRIEGKIECVGAVIMLGLLIFFWNNNLVEGILGIVASVWALGKIYFRRDQKLFLILIFGLVFFQGLSHIFAYFRSH